MSSTESSDKRFAKKCPGSQAQRLEFYINSKIWDCLTYHCNSCPMQRWRHHLENSDKVGGRKHADCGKGLRISQKEPHLPGKKNPCNHGMRHETQISEEDIDKIRQLLGEIDCQFTSFKTELLQHQAKVGNMLLGMQGDEK